MKLNIKDEIKMAELNYSEYTNSVGVSIRFLGNRNNKEREDTK
ncbi:hypothetical protein [Aminipila terrae]|nr:hypothetical protein [Aminipila terrae]